MDIVDDSQLNLTYLSEELELYRPDFNHSVAGILPEVIGQWSVDITLDSDLSSFATLGKQLEASHPSGYDNILLILVDGLGVLDLERFGGMIYENIITSGTVASSTFPSITSTVMTSLMYGVQPSNHGITGYNIYNEHLDSIWNVLRLRYLKDNHVTEVLSDVELSDLVGGRALSPQIEDQGYPVTYFVPDFLKPPGLGNVLNPSFPQRGYSDLQDVYQKVYGLLNNSQDEKQMITVYFPEPDGVAHAYGPDSSEYRDQVSWIEKVVQQFKEIVANTNGSTLVMLTSDHGLSSIDKQLSPPMFIHNWENFRDQGTLLSFSGRTTHAYSTHSEPEKTRDLLETLVDPNHSVIIDQKEAMGLAGGNSKYANRMGDYCVLSANEYMFHVPNSIATQNEEVSAGHHGSLSARELFVPVAIFSQE